MSINWRPKTPRALLQRVLLRRSLARTDRSRGKHGAAYTRLLYTSQTSSPERQLAHRAALVAAMLALVILVFWLERENLRDAADGHISFADVIYFTMVTVTTVLKEPQNRKVRRAARSDSP